MLAAVLPTTGYPAIDWLIYTGAVVTAVGLIWRGVVHPTIKAFNQIDQYGPVLTEIAKQFKSDSGSTLKDTVTRLEEAATRNVSAIKEAEARAKIETATLARLEIALGVLEGRMTGDIRSRTAVTEAAADKVKATAAAEAAADKVKATAADVAAALVEVVNPDPIKVQVVNPEPIDVRVDDDP